MRVRGLTEISIIAVFILISATLYATKRREQPRIGQESDEDSDDDIVLGETNKQ